MGGATLGRKTTEGPEVLEQSMWNRLNRFPRLRSPFLFSNSFESIQEQRSPCFQPGAQSLPLTVSWQGVGCRRERCRKQLALSPDCGTYERCRSVLVFCYFRVRGSMEQLLEYGSFLLNPWSLTFPMFVAIVIVKEQRASRSHPSNLRVSACTVRNRAPPSQKDYYHYFHLCHSVRRSRSFICARPYTRKVGYVLLESGGCPPIDRLLPVTQSLTQQDTVSKSG